MEDNKEKDYSRFMPPQMRGDLEDENREASVEEIFMEEEVEPDINENIEEEVEKELVPPPFLPPQSDASEESASRDHSGRSVAPDISAPRRLNAWEGIAKFVYDVFNPFLIPAYATLLLFELSVLALTAPGATLAYTLTVFGATCVLPLVVLLFLRRVGVISSLSMPDRASRTLPYAVALLTIGAVTVLFVYRGAPAWIWTIYLGGCVTVLLNLLANYRVKVCNHASGAAALLAMFVVLQMKGMPVHPLGWWVIATVIVCGVVGASAMLVGRHRLIDVMVGYITGFLPIVLISLIH